MLLEDKRPIRIVVIDGSVRYQGTCPDQGGKTTKLAKHAMVARPSGVKVDYIDLRVKGDGMIVQPCKGCVSTAGGFHCHWPCSCYGPGSGGSDLPDLMYDQSVYDKLKQCDGFLVFTPTHWYAPSTSVKAMFDRLVCASRTLTVDDASRLTGGNIKDASKTRPLSKAGEHDHLLQDHLAGRIGGFFIHGLDGANDFKWNSKTPGNPPDQIPTLDPRDERGYDPVDALEGVIRTCRYMGIKVPEDLVVGLVLGNNRVDYAGANDLPLLDAKRKAAALMKGLVKEIRKQQPGT